MRWSIRNQILFPLIGIQLMVVVGVSCLATWWSVRAVEIQVGRRLEELDETVRNARFPLTASVLEQMKRLSACEFLIVDQAGNAISSTLDVDDEDRNQIDQARTGSLSPASPAIVSLPSGKYRCVVVSSQIHGAPAEVMMLYPEARIQSARRDAVMFPACLGALTLVLTSIAVAFVAYRMGRRIQAIERQVAKVTQQDFRPIPLSQIDDELRDLAASVNWMSGKLEQMTAEVRETEQARLIKQLAAGIAHQLRNSLTGARMAIQIHQRRCSRSDDQSLSVALRQLTLTEEQIRGLVALIRDEHRARVPGSLERIIQEVEKLVQPLSEHRKVLLTFSGDVENFVIQDSEQMRAALLNLCLNAIEASPSGGHVDIHRHAARNEVVIEVSDNGPGVSEDVVDSLFDPFHTTKGDGLGLGLALVRQAAHDHFGSVVYERNQERTVFRLRCRGVAPDAAGEIHADESLSRSPVPVEMEVQS